MQKFFLLLLKINGVILLLLSIVILAQIWFEPFSGKDLFSRIIGSYFVVVVNFLVLSSVISNAHKLERGKDKDGQITGN